MSAASAQTFSYMNKSSQQPATTGYRYAIDDRFRWAAPVNEANFYAVSCFSFYFFYLSLSLKMDTLFNLIH